MSDLDKITEQHRRLRAIVYVRQSSPGQVQNNHESRACSMRFGSGRSSWDGRPMRSRSSMRIRPVGRRAEGRLGFKELVAEVGLGHVGLILGLEVSRLARNNADWHRLLDLCALTGTLIADATACIARATSTTGCCSGYL